jgi:hypothetical protein
VGNVEGALARWVVVNYKDKTDRQIKRGLAIFIGLIVFHLAVSVLLSIIARSNFLSSLHNGQGLWNFALDSFVYHQEALRLSGLLKSGDFNGWWGSSPFWHVKWIALPYAILVADPLSFAPINSLIWAITIYCVYKIVNQLLPDRRRLAIVTALTFGLWPSYFLHTTQLLKDPLYIMGMLMMFWGCVNILSGRRAIISVLIIVVGVLIAYLNRTYILEPLIFLSLLAAVLGVWQVRGGWVQAAVAIVLILGMGVYGYIQRPEIQIPSLSELGDDVNEISQPQEEILSRSQDSSSSPLIRLVEKGVVKIAYFRERYIKKYPNAGTNIDRDVHFRSLKDILAYIPRAAIIGFLAPFPSHWFGTPKTAGPASRILAGLEMILWYILLPGFLYFLFAGPVALPIRIWMLVYTFTLVVLTSLVVTNIGALHRLRYVYFLPILIGGLEGWARFYVQRFQKA